MAAKERIVAAAAGAWRGGIGGGAGSRDPLEPTFAGPAIVRPAAGAASFSPVEIVLDSSAPAAATSTIEIELAGGVCMRIMGAVDPVIVSALITALAKTARSR